ncbi:MAG: hypothetical protein WC966_11410, partial [Bradymonadales bacterium]
LGGGAGGGKRAGRGIGGGGGGKGAIAVPSIGGGASTLEPKPEGSGKNAIERFANSGLSHQIKNLGGLGGKADIDYQKTKSELEGNLPDEGGSEGAHEANTAKATAEAEATKASNSGLENSELDTSATIDEGNQRALSEGQKAGYSGASDDLPAKANIEVDKSAVESATSEEAEKFAAAQSEGSSKVAELKKELPTRGYDDIKAEKVEVDIEGAVKDSGDSASLADVQELSSEGQGILDITDLATSTASQMQSVKAQVDAAEEKTKSESEQAIAKHEEEIEQERQKANEEEQNALDSKKAELEAQISAESASYEGEISAYDAEQQGHIKAADARLEAERSKAQAQIDSEHAKAQSEKQAKEREANDQKEKSRLEKAAEAVKNMANKAIEFLKEAVSKIVRALKSAIFALIDGFVAIVSSINKELGDKLRKGFEKFKQFVEKLAEALIRFVEQALDFIAKLITEIVDRVVEAIKTLVENLKNLLSELISALKAAFDAAVESIKAILSSLGEVFKRIFLKACELAGVDSSIFASAMGSVREIIKNPGQFFGALARGFVQGFKNFGANIGENVKAIFSNLWNLWLGSAGVSMPGSFSIPSLIKLGLEIIGVNVDSILAQLGIKNIDDLSDIDESAPVVQFVRELQAGGIMVLVKHIQSFVGDLAQEIMQAAIQSIVVSATKQAIAKLAMLATPVSGIIAALKAVWDLVQFVRSNLGAIGALATAVVSLMGGAAQGDSSGVAAGVEAALCQAIPLAIDLCLRLAGINVGGKISELLSKIRGKVKGAVDGVIGKFSGAASKTRAGRAVRGAQAKIIGVQTAAKEKVGARASRINDKIDNKINSGVDKFNQTSFGQKVGNVNTAAQNAANTINTGIAEKKEKRENRVFNASGITSALNGEKTGNLGVNLNNASSLNKEEKKEAK